MTENLRNEVQIDLGDGAPYTLRASFDAVCGIERDLNTNLIPLIAKYGRQDIGLMQAAIVIYHGMTGFGDTRFSVSQIGEKIMKVGLSGLQVKLIQFLGIAMKGVSVRNPPATPPQA